MNDNLNDRQVENRRAAEDHELTDAGGQDNGNKSILQELEDGLAGAIELNANGGNPDTPATIGQSGAGTPNNT